MRKVVVAEKPSVARDLARVLGARTRRDHWIERADGLRVTWTLGHLVELKTPDDYDPRLKRWRLDGLPFVPERFELRPSGDASARRQLDAVVALCGEADELVCATDAGREGELIFRYVLEYGGLAERPFQRLWLSSMTDAAIRTAFGALRPRTDYEALFHAARCRSEADWIVGINATRFHTVRFGGGSVLWSVGRVQTPVLALIAEREDEIRTFVPRPFWELRTLYRGATFRRTEGRFDDAESAERALAAVRDVEFEIKRVERRRETSPPPLLHDLTSLQRLMNQRHGMSAAQTLKVAQELYEKKLLTYPRTDSRHLPSGMAGQIADALRSLRDVDPDAVGRVDLDALPTPRRVFDDSKVTDHHAIVPTGNAPGGLAGDAQHVFTAVLRRLCQVFMADRLRDVTTVDGMAADVAFRARGVHVVEPGWTALEPEVKKRPARGKARSGEDDDGGDEDAEQELPEFREGERGPHEPSLHQGETKAPRAWTESSLLGAMETAGRFVEDEELREALKARGIGTPATRAAILETLIRRGYVVRDKKALRCTDLGRYLVGLVADPLLLSPELTGDWEAKLREIEGGRLDPGRFIADIVDWVRAMCRSGGDGGEGLGTCPRCGAEIIEGREGYGCSAWRDGCSFVLWKAWRGVALSRSDAGYLLRHRLLPEPIRIPDIGPRVLCMTKQGLLLDLEPPSRDRQKEPPKPPRSSKPAPESDAALPGCPRCGNPLVEGQRGYGCSGWRSGCDFVVWKIVDGRKITAANVRTLIEKGRTRPLSGFKKPDGTPFRARLVLTDDRANWYRD
ncbi:MAG: topoisomerase C-terminal repeat-containing protein [Planctomycetes bacterium]|nr:topoisomerase C-terminal repeat-containing protein [Planctomycetota bacterium]